MRVVAAAAKRLYSFRSLRPHSTLISSSHLSNTLTHSQPSIIHPADRRPRLLTVPWSATQLRFAKTRGADVRPGNVIERKGKNYQVVKAQHSTQGRGAAVIQESGSWKPDAYAAVEGCWLELFNPVELRDIDSGNKVNERFRTDEMVEKVFVEAKSFTYLYTDEESESVVLMEPNTFVQLDVPKHLFGESLAYLKDDITVTVELFNDRPMSASVPKRVTCTVAEAQAPMKGMGATAHTKKVLLDNGLTVQVPIHITTGDKILIDTTDNSYVSRA